MMKQDASQSMLKEIMTEFASLTGLSPSGKVSPRRYLWTDAFAVCNFLELYNQTRDEKYKGFALGLVDQVHKIFGRHRDDDLRTGCLSGLNEQEGMMHPTKGGLRIGKEINERGPADYRLAFRELGLSIGLKSIEKLQVWIEQNQGLFNKKQALDFEIESLMRYSPLSEMIEMFWIIWWSALGASMHD